MSINREARQTTVLLGVKSGSFHQHSVINSKFKRKATQIDAYEEATLSTSNSSRNF